MLFFWSVFVWIPPQRLKRLLCHVATHHFNFSGHSTICFHFKTVWVGQKGSEKITLWRWNECTWGSSWKRVKKVVCCLRTGLQNDLVKARGSSPGLSAELRLWQLTARSWALQRPAGLFAHNTRTCDGASVSYVFVSMLMPFVIHQG